MKQLLPKLLYRSFILVHGLGFCSQAQGVSQIHHLLPPETRWNERIPGEKKAGTRKVAGRGRFGFKATPQFILHHIFITRLFCSDSLYFFQSIAPAALVKMTEQN